MSSAETATVTALHIKNIPNVLSHGILENKKTIRVLMINIIREYVIHNRLLQYLILIACVAYISEDRTIILTVTCKVRIMSHLLIKLPSTFCFTCQSINVNVKLNFGV